MGVGQLCSGDALLVGGIQFAIADVFHDGPGEEVDILQHDAKRAPQIRLVNPADVDAVIDDGTVVNVVEPVDQVGDGRLTGAGGANECQLLSRLCKQRNVVQHRLALFIAEIDIEEPDIAAQLCVGGIAVRPGDLPGPVMGAGGRFGDRAVGGNLGVDQGDIAVVLLRRLIEKRKDPLCTGQRHDDEVELLGDLADGLVEGLAQLQKRDDGAEGHHIDAEQGDIGDAAQCNDGAHDGENDILQVAQIHHDGHQNIAVGVGAGGVLAQVLIDPVKALLGLFLMAEDLDDLLAVHHLFNVAVDSADGPLLGAKIAGAVAGDMPHCQKNQRQQDNDQQGHPKADGEHGDKGDHNRGDGADELRNALREHLAQRVGVIGVVTHQIAVRVGVKIANGERLHVAEHLLPDPAQNTLRDGDHQARIDECGQNAADIDHGHARQRIGEGCEYGGCRAEQGRDIVVDQRLQKQAGSGRCTGADEDEEEDGNKMPFIVL